MNERRARNLLPRPSGVDPHSFTPPRLPPKLWVSAFQSEGVRSPRGKSQSLTRTQSG